MDTVYRVLRVTYPLGCETYPLCPGSLVCFAFITRLDWAKGWSMFLDTCRGAGREHTTIVVIIIVCCLLLFELLPP